MQEKESIMTVWCELKSKPCDAKQLPSRQNFQSTPHKIQKNHLSRLMTKSTKWSCTQQRLRSAWASAQSDQSWLSAWRKAWVLSYPLSTSEDSDQTGWSESSLGTQVFLLVLSWCGSFRNYTEHWTVLLMNRLNKTESGIYIACVISLFPKDPFFRIGLYPTRASAQRGTNTPRPAPCLNV